MPRYYINVLNDDSFTPDEQGVELADIAAAMLEAKKAAAEIICDELVAGKDAIHLDLVINDDSGRGLTGLRVVTTVTRDE